MNKSKKLLSVMLIVAMLTVTLAVMLSTLTLPASAAPETDYTGYYKIENAGNLAWFACLVVGDDSQPGSGITEAVPNAKAVLTADIDMSTLAAWGKTWSGIGTSEIPFTGVFDGNGYTIKNLTIDTSADSTLTTSTVATISTTTAEQGLFGVIGEGGVVRDLVLEGTAKVGDSAKLGAVCSVNNGTIENVLSKMTVEGGDSPNAFVHTNNGTVKSCFTTETCSLSGVTVTTTEALADGSVTWALGDSFGQVIGTDLQPVHYNGENRVYYDYASCAEGGEKTYSNTPKAHSTTAAGDRAATCSTLAYCSVCDKEYGEVDPDAHVFDKDCTDATCNMEDCEGTRSAQRVHSYTDHTDTTCNNEGCEVTRAAHAENAYVFDAATGSMRINTNEGVTAWEGVVHPDDILSMTVAADVTTVSEDDFADLANMTSLVFEGNIVLPTGSFANATTLKTIEFKGTSTLSVGAFSGATAVESITFGGATGIGSGLFSDCSKLETLTFPAGSTIDSGAFGSATGLTSVTFMGDVDLSAGGVFSSATALKTIEFKGTSVLNSGAFGGATALESITFGDVTTIGSGILGNSKLTTLTFPAGSTIGSGSFGSATSLTSVTFEGDIDLSAGGIFSSATALKTIEFKGTSTLANSAFFGATALESITFGDVATIGDGIFTGCSKLETLTFPADSTIGDGSFSGASGLTSVTFMGDIDLSGDGNGGIFAGTSALKTIVFKGTSKLANGAFNGANALESVTFGDVTTIGSGIFSGNKLTTLTFPAGSTIGGGSFGGSSGLTSVTFEGNIDLSGGGVFSGTTALKTIVFKGTSVLNTGAFSGATAVESVTFGGAATIGSGIFGGNKLETLTFPAGSEIGGGSFSGSSKLTSVTFEGDIDLSGGGVFGSVPALKTIVFKGTSNLNSGAFGGATALESITFGGAATIGDGILMNSRLTTLTFPAGSTVGDASFSSSTALTSVIFEGDIVLSGSAAFDRCTALKTVEFKGDCTVSNTVFASASSLETVIFGGSVTISDYAFTSVYDNSGDDVVFESSCAQSILLRGETASIAAGSLVNFADTVRLYVACSTYDAYAEVLRADAACNAAFVENLVATHTYNEGVVTTQPTCTAKGVKTYTCTQNSAHTRTEHVEINADAHAYNEGVVTTQPTCTAKGVKIYTCTHNSAHTYTEEIACTEHVYDNACDSDCNACGTVRTATEHYSENADGKCDECNESYQLSAGAVVGIVVGSVAVAGVGGFAIFWFVIKKKKWSDLIGIFKK